MSTTTRSTQWQRTDGAKGVRLHMFECGTLNCHVENIKLNQGLGEEYEIPVPWFLVEHPRGTGRDRRRQRRRVRRRPGAALGQDQRGLLAGDDAGAGVRAGVEGGRLRPGRRASSCCSRTCTSTTPARSVRSTSSPTRVIATRAEYEYAHVPDWFAAGGYIQADFNKPGVPWALLEDTEDGYDVFGDGVIRCWHTPGHAPGSPVVRGHAAQLRHDPAHGRRRLHDRPLEREGAARLPRLGRSTRSARCESSTGSRRVQIDRGHRARPRDVADVQARPGGV